MEIYKATLQSNITTDVKKKREETWCNIEKFFRLAMLQTKKMGDNLMLSLVTESLIDSTFGGV
jgi:hypothetical protein